MTKAEFLRELQNYYGGFKNDAVRDYFVAELGAAKEPEFEPLLRRLFRTCDRYPTVKALYDALRELRNGAAAEERALCPLCGKALSAGMCLSRSCPGNAGAVSGEEAMRVLGEIRRMCAGKRFRAPGGAQKRPPDARGLPTKRLFGKNEK